MLRLFTAIFSFALFFSVFNPTIDIAPGGGSGSGDCSLVSEAHANIPPPSNVCKGKKAGDTCETYFNTTGKCQLVCPYPNPTYCEREDQKVMSCVDNIPDPVLTPEPEKTAPNTK